MTIDITRLTHEQHSAFGGIDSVVTVRLAHQVVHACVWTSYDDYRIHLLGEVPVGVETAAVVKAVETAWLARIEAEFFDQLTTN